MPKRYLYLVAYDITESSRRARVLAACKGHGLGGQKSVHECWLSKGEQRELQASLLNVIDHETDDVRFYSTNDKTEILIYGKTRMPEGVMTFGKGALGIAGGESQRPKAKS